MAFWGPTFWFLHFWVSKTESKHFRSGARQDHSANFVPLQSGDRERGNKAVDQELLYKHAKTCALHACCIMLSVQYSASYAILLLWRSSQRGSWHFNARTIWVTFLVFACRISSPLRQHWPKEPPGIKDTTGPVPHGHPLKQVFPGALSRLLSTGSSLYILVVLMVHWVPEKQRRLCLVWRNRNTQTSARAFSWCSALPFWRGVAGDLV